MIHFAGVPTLLPSPEVERYINALIGDVYSGPGGGAQIGGKAPNLPQMNWRKHWQPRVNTLIWPTGASRWASMYLLVDDLRLAAIVESTSVLEGSVTEYRASSAQLKICDSRFTGAPLTVLSNAWTRDAESDRVGLSTAMYALQPRPLSLPYTPAGSGEPWVASEERTVWLLPIVDERWLWQWKNVGEHNTWATWTEAITSTAPEGITISTIHADFGTPPDPVAFDWGNTAATMDALAHSVGQRIVRGIDGEVYSISAADGAIIWGDNLKNTRSGTPTALAWQRLSGGVYSGMFHAGATIPEKIRVVFASGESETVLTRDAGADEYRPGTEYVMFTGAEADDRLLYANKAAAAWLEWLQLKADVAYAGVKAWNFTGFEDCLMLTHGSIGDGEWAASTRISTLPENLALEQQGGGQATCPNRYVLEYLGNPTGGSSTVKLYGSYHGVALAPNMIAAIPWDATNDEIRELLETANGYDPLADPVTGFAVVVSLGPLPNNDVTITLPRGVMLRVTANALTPTSATRFAKIRV